MGGSAVPEARPRGDEEDLGPTFISIVSRKRAIYLPKQVCEGIGVDEGDCVLMRVKRLRSGVSEVGSVVRPTMGSLNQLLRYP